MVGQMFQNWRSLRLGDFKPSQVDSKRDRVDSKLDRVDSIVDRVDSKPDRVDSKPDRDRLDYRMFESSRFQTGLSNVRIESISGYDF